jgi:hypothetical protein
MSARPSAPPAADECAESFAEEDVSKIGPEDGAGGGSGASAGAKACAGAGIWGDEDDADGRKATEDVARACPPPQEPPAFIEHVVRTTDTLQGLCLWYKISVRELKRWNDFPRVRTCAVLWCCRPRRVMVPMASLTCRKTLGS